MNWKLSINTLPSIAVILSGFHRWNSLHWTETHSHTHWKFCNKKWTRNTCTSPEKKKLSQFVEANKRIYLARTKRIEFLNDTMFNIDATASVKRSLKVQVGMTHTSKGALCKQKQKLIDEESWMRSRERNDDGARPTEVSRRLVHLCLDPWTTPQHGGGCRAPTPKGKEGEGIEERGEKGKTRRKKSDKADTCVRGRDSKSL